MTIPSDLRNDINFLYNLKYQKNSVSLSHDKVNLKRIKKDSCLKNFLRWFIHIITCTLVPRNRDLDAVSSRILNKTKDLDKWTDTTSQDKVVLKAGLENLYMIIQKNGGKDAAKVKNLINKIKSLEIVQKIESNQEKTSTENAVERKNEMQQTEQVKIGLAAGNSAAQILVGFENFNFVHLLDDESLNKLIKLVQEDFIVSKNEGLYDLFLTEVLKSCLKNEGIWKLDWLYTSGNPTILKRFFQLIDAFEDEALKWELFDQLTQNQLKKPEGYNTPGVFDKNRIIPHDIDYISMLSEEQRRRLSLEKYEIQLNLFLAIVNRTLDLPKVSEEAIKKVRNMDSAQKENFYWFIRYWHPQWSHLTFLTKTKIEHLHYFFAWLGKLNPEPEILADCIKWIFTKNEYLRSDVINQLSQLLDTFSKDVLKKYVGPCLFNDLSMKSSDVKFLPAEKDNNLKIILKLMQLLECKDVCMLIDQQWHNISRYIIDHRQWVNLVDFSKKIIKYINESTRLKIILKDPLFEYANDLKLHAINDYHVSFSREEAFQVFFDHLERYPWKLFLLLDDKQYNSDALREWIAEENYPICKDILNKYHRENLTQQEVDNHNKQLQTFFALAKDFKFVEALEKYHQLTDEIKEYLVTFSRHESMEVICEELPFMNEALLLVALLDEQANKNLREVLAMGCKENLFRKEDLNQLIQLAIDMKSKLASGKEKSLLENFLSHPLEYEGSNNFLLHKCYNDTRHSDMIFKFGDEKVHVHRAFLYLDSDLKKYIPAKANQEVEIYHREETDKIKSAIKKIYSFQIKDLISPRSDIKSLYNNPQSYPDFIFTCGPEKIYAHQVMLDLHLPYFSALLNSQMKEAISGSLEVHPDEFEGLKAVLEYTYTLEMPEFAEKDEVSRKAFSDALKYYKAEEVNFKHVGSNVA